MKKSTQATIGTVIAVIVLIVLGVLGVDVEELLAPSTNPVRQPDDVVISSTTADWYDIYFTNPSCPSEEERTGGLDEIIAADLLLAQAQVDVAGFDVDARPIIDALIELEDRGVNVRFVTDDEHTPASTTNRLRRNGITVVEDQRTGLMHNKFIVIDGRYLWVGSLNFTSNGVYCNNNNIVRFDAPTLALNYTLEMDEMYNDRSFGPRSPQNSRPIIQINSSRLENYFASEDEIAPILGEQIEQAQEEILFLAFSFTHEDIGEPMLERAEEGVIVRGVFENTGSETIYSYYPVMLDAGLNNVIVRQDGNRRIMHHKVIIIDRETVVFGSYNFSGNANDINDENIIIVHDPEFAGFFVEEFEQVWQEAQ